MQQSILRQFFPERLLLPLTGQKLLLPVYHLVSDLDVPHIKHLYRYRNIQAFKDDLNYFLTHFEPIDLNQLIEISHGKTLQKPSFLLTFDDGLQEFGSVIAPILKQKGLPAICFLNNAFIDNQALFFRYKVSLLIEALLTTTSPHLRAQLSSMLPQHNLHLPVVQRMLALHYEDQSLINAVAHLLEVDFTSYLDAQRPYLTEEAIKSLINDGFYFGAHSIDHPTYSRLSRAEQINQTTRSLEDLANRFPNQPQTFAFPFIGIGAWIINVRKCPM